MAQTFTMVQVDNLDVLEAIAFTTLPEAKLAASMENGSTVAQAHKWAALMASAFTIVQDGK